MQLQSVKETLGKARFAPSGYNLRRANHNYEFSSVKFNNLTSGLNFVGTLYASMKASLGDCRHSLKVDLFTSMLESNQYSAHLTVYYLISLTILTPQFLKFGFYRVQLLVLI